MAGIELPGAVEVSTSVVVVDPDLAPDGVVRAGVLHQDGYAWPTISNSRVGHAGDLDGTLAGGKVGVRGLWLAKAPLASVGQQREAFGATVENDEVLTAGAGKIVGHNADGLQLAQNRLLAGVGVDIDVEETCTGTIASLRLLAEGMARVVKQHTEVARNLVADHDVLAVPSIQSGKGKVGWPHSHRAHDGRVELAGQGNGDAVVEIVGHDQVVAAAVAGEVGSGDAHGQTAGVKAGGTQETSLAVFQLWVPGVDGCRIT